MIHENQTDWQRQLNFDVGQNSHKSQSNHILGTSSNDTNEQHQLQDIFGRSTKRPISAPPTSDEAPNTNNGFIRNGFPSSNHVSEKSWNNDDSNLYRNNQVTHLQSKIKISPQQQYHLPNHFDFRVQEKSLKDSSSNSDFSTQSNHMESPSESLSSSVLSGLGIFSANDMDEKNNSSSNSSSLSKLDILQTGLRRPASTGVIGNPRNDMAASSTSVMESLGLVSSHKNNSSKLDLIQEDFPKPPSPEYNLPEKKNESTSTSTSSLQHAAQRDSYLNHHSTTTSNGGISSHPVSSIQYSTYSQNLAEAPYSIHQQQEKMMYNPSNSNFNNFDGNNLGEQQHQQHTYNNISGLHPQIQPKFHVQGVNGHTLQQSSPPRQGLYQTTVSNGGPTYPNNNNLHHHQQQQQVLRQHASFEQQPVYYDAQRRNNTMSGPPRIIPSGSNTQQPIYVNPPAYGTYATVQYHQGHPPTYQPNPVVIHPHDPSISSRFISMPVQGSMPAQVSTNGAYIYFHQPADGGAINILQPNNNRRNQYKAATKVVNDRTRKNRMKKSGVSDQENGSSALLEEFRVEKNRSWTALDVKGHIVEFCQDQNGSRFIQQRLEVADEAEKVLIMEDVLPEMSKLRVDIFGNYVVQKLFDFGTPDMIDKMKQTVVGDMLDLSKQIYGCRVVQKALEIVNDESLLELLSELHGNLLSCIHDQNGNHVIQKCVEVINSRAAEHKANGNYEMEQRFKEETQLLMECVTSDILSLSCHPYGCRVFQRILEHFDDEQKGQILNSLRHHHKNLLDDQYGNYVIQHVLRYGKTEDRSSVLDIVVNNSLLQLSRQKFASNVVEKLLKYGDDDHRRLIVREMLKVTQISGIDGSKEESTVVLMMVRDAYANYVVQTTLDVVPEGEEKRLLFDELNNNSALLRNFTFAKHIITKLGAN